MKFLRPLHALAGLACLLLFVGSGQYMHLVHEHLRGMPDVTRMLFRSAHIYLLLAALLNLALGLYLEVRSAPAARWAQLTGSVLIVAAPMLAGYSFFTESLQPGIDRLVARWVAYLALAGVLLHMLAAWVLSRPRREDVDG